MHNIYYINTYIGTLTVKAKKCGVDVDRLHVILKARNVFKKKKTNKKTKTNYVLFISLVYISIISLLFFFLMKKENEGISFLA